MFLGIAIGLVEFDRALGLTDPFETSSQVVSRRGLPKRSLGFSQHALSEPVLGSVVTGIVVLNETDPVGGGAFAAAHHRLSLGNLALKHFFVDSQVASHAVSTLQVDIDIQIFDFELRRPLRQEEGSCSLGIILFIVVAVIRQIEKAICVRHFV